MAEEQNAFISTLPGCMTLENGSDQSANILTIKSCAYEEVNGVRKVIDQQMWRVTGELSTDDPGPPPMAAGTQVFVLTSLAHEDSCIKERNSSECKYYYTGHVDIENDCTFNPSGIGICGVQSAP